MLNRSRWLVLFLLLFVPACGFSANLAKEFAGFVTEVSPGHSFSVGWREVQWSPSDTRIYQTQNRQRIDEPADAVVRVGSFVHVDGKFIKRTGKFIAKDVELLAPSLQDQGSIHGIGLIEQKPRLSTRGAGAEGTLWVDGYPLHVTQKTRLLWDDGKPFDASKITTNLWARYDASRVKDGSIEARTITFARNSVSDEEAKFLKGTEPVIEPPDYAKHRAGTIKFHRQWSLKILPDRAVQDYVARVGESLIPAYQKELPESDPTKIDFRFYVVEPASMLKRTLRDNLTNDCQSSGGIVLVPDYVLAVLDNEAQLASLLSDCVEVTLEKQTYFHRKRLKAQSDIAIASDVGSFLSIYALPATVGGSIAARQLWLEVNEKASRIGLRDMVRQGYDIREAPFAWTIAANQNANNPNEYLFHPPALVSSVMKDLYFEYPSVDYSKLTKRRSAYHVMLRRLHKAAHKLPRSKNYPDNAKS